MQVLFLSFNVSMASFPLQSFSLYLDCTASKVVTQYNPSHFLGLTVTFLSAMDSTANKLMHVLILFILYNVKVHSSSQVTMTSLRLRLTDISETLSKS